MWNAVRGNRRAKRALSKEETSASWRSRLISYFSHDNPFILRYAEVDAVQTTVSRSNAGLGSNTEPNMPVVAGNTRLSGSPQTFFCSECLLVSVRRMGKPWRLLKWITSSGRRLAALGRVRTDELIG
jgi:hypothetical protein